MRTVLLMVVAFIALTASTVWAGQSMTVTGEVVDLSCYIAAGASGDSHKTCAIGCLTAGEPAGILDTKAGKIYVVVTEDHKTPPSAKILPFVAQTVEVTGMVNERNGVSTIDIMDIKPAAGSAMGMMDMGMKGEGMMKKDMMKGEMMKDEMMKEGVMKK